VLTYRPSVQAAREFVTDPSLAEAMGRIGVQAPVRLERYEEADR
jgi:hypothetical protein